MTKLRPGLCPELSTEVYYKLQQFGVKTILEFLQAEPDLLSQKTSLSYKTITLLRKSLVSRYAPQPTSGSALCERLLSGLAIFTTGCADIDLLLDGGIYSGEVTEIVGKAASGKTQFCLCLAAALVLNTQRSVLYFDTSSSFCARRVLEILLNRGVSRESANPMLERIKRTVVNDVQQLVSVLEDRKQWSLRFGPALAIVIVDSISALLSPILGGHQEDGMGLMVHVAQLLKALAVEKMVAVVTCNGVVHGDLASSVKPALGRFWRHVPSVSILIDMPNSFVEKNGCHMKGDYRSFTINKSCRQPTGQQGMCRLGINGFS